jgi:hypothetical protein
MIIEAVEGAVLTAAQWCEKLSCGPSDLDRMLVDGMLRPQPDGALRLRLVGVAVIGGSVLVSRPDVKWATCQKSLSQYVRQLDALLRMYRERSLRRGVTADSIRLCVLDQRVAHQAARAMELFETLLALTAAYGFHEQESRERATVEYGRIDWQSTIAHSVAMHGRGGVVYHQPRTHALCSRLSNLGMLQALALHECGKRYGRLLHDADPSTTHILDHAEALVYEHALAGRGRDLITDAEQSIGNRDHEKEVLAAARACYDGLAHARGGNEIASLWGTTAFHLVWEDMCRCASGCTVLPELVRSEPCYNLNSRSFPTDRQRPDLAFEERGALFVCDAKYYPRFPETFPGLEDVRKQFFYGLSSHSERVVLCFLLPGRAEGIIERLGSARMQACGEVDSRFPEVHCLLVDWETLCALYIGRTPTLPIRAMIADACGHS